MSMSSLKLFRWRKSKKTKFWANKIQILALHGKTLLPYSPAVNCRYGRNEGGVTKNGRCTNKRGLLKFSVEVWGCIKKWVRLNFVRNRANEGLDNFIECALNGGKLCWI